MTVKLFAAVQQQELEGIVAKRLSSCYIPAVRGWVKIKNRDYRRYELERESAINKPRVKQFVERRVPWRSRSCSFGVMSSAHQAQ